MATSSGKIILDYHDSIIHESDMALIENKNWLNDIIVSFYYEFLEKEKFKKEVDSNEMGFVNASSVQCIKLCDDIQEVNMCFLEPLELSKKRFVFFPLNNNQHSLKSGGSHWSLLVHSRDQKTFFHFDSGHGMNDHEATFLYKRIKNYFNANNIVLVNVYAQQSNSYDCGVYVLGKFQ